jgi:nuclear receptor coactivator 2
MMCIVRRIKPNEDTSGLAPELFITKLDTAGKIIGIDTSGVSSTYSQYLNRVKIVFLNVLLFCKCCGRGD